MAWLRLSQDMLLYIVLFIEKNVISTKTFHFPLMRCNNMNQLLSKQMPNVNIYSRKFMRIEMLKTTEYCFILKLNGSLRGIT